MAAKKHVPAYKNPDLPSEWRLDDLIVRLTVDEKISLLSETAPGIARLGIRPYNHGNEALHGVVRPGRFTVFPRPTGLAATFNPALIRAMASAVGDEARAGHNRNRGRMIGGDFGGKYNGLLTFWSPVVNMVRDPRWGRTGETYGEDPLLTSLMGSAFVRGLQGDHAKYIKAVATPKHYTANNEEHNRFSCKAVIPQRWLREYYLPAYRACVAAGAQSLMAAYNAVNGVPCSANHFLLTEVLRWQWGFDGYVVGDLNSTLLVMKGHHYTATLEQTAAACLRAGLELDSGFLCYPALAQALADGMVSRRDIDRAAWRILQGRMRLGLLDEPESVPFNKIKPDVIGCRKHQALALKIARESMVLLKNAPVLSSKSMAETAMPHSKSMGETPMPHNKAPLLPLDNTKIKSIAVMGPNCLTYKHHHYSGEPINEPITPLAGIVAAAGKNVKVTHVPWLSLDAKGFMVIPDMYLRPAGGAETQQGLAGEYFHNHDLRGKPAGRRVDARIEFHRADQQPDPMFASTPLSIRWSGTLTAPSAGKYQLAVTCGGGVRLHVDGRTIIDNWDKRQAGRDAAAVTFAAGHQAAVVLEYRDLPDKRIEEGVTAAVKLEWLPPAGAMARRNDPYLAAAAQADVVIAVLGTNVQYAGEGKDKFSLNLPAEQEKFIRRVARVNPRTIVVLVNSEPLAINWVDAHCPAVLEAWFPGEQAGRAIADVLWGRYNPAGRLPMTFYKSTGQLPPFNNYDIARGRTYMFLRQEPLYAFGHGLSYTTFKYSPAALSRGSASPGGRVIVSVSVTNTGSRDGEEVVQLYVHNRRSRAPQPIKQLKGFKRVAIKAGRTVKVDLPLAVDDLAWWDERAGDEGGWVVESGLYDILVGAASDDIRARATLRVEEAAVVNASQMSRTQK
ncbi:MAG: glycoside hydrolase family 3 C-terminal domain-containing protein [Planctomycetaceae bacterium]|nr:glycoside hydrolase family 3 C-terminal domain-containing protein [Planctomycetaceae bacterium]